MACKDIDGYSSEKPCPDESHQDSLLETNTILTKIFPFLPVDKKRLDHEYFGYSQCGVSIDKYPRSTLNRYVIDTPSKTQLTVD